MDPTNKKQSILKNGTVFTVLGDAKNQERTAYRDVSVEIIQTKMRLVYFKLGGMTCRASIQSIQ